MQRCHSRYQVIENTSQYEFVNDSNNSNNVNNDYMLYQSCEA